MLTDYTKMHFVNMNLFELLTFHGLVHKIPLNIIFQLKFVLCLFFQNSPDRDYSFFGERYFTFLLSKLLNPPLNAGPPQGVSPIRCKCHYMITADSAFSDCQVRHSLEKSGCISYNFSRSLVTVSSYKTIAFF